VSILGIGYEGLSLETFISRLRLHSADVLIDVRLNAISRKKGFSKKSLDSALEAAGILYLHMPSLGNERDNRDGYAELGSEPGESARSRFRTALAQQASADDLRHVAELCAKQKVFVFCFEADERHCHREQVIEAVNKLAERDLAAV